MKSDGTFFIHNIKDWLALKRGKNESSGCWQQWFIFGAILGPECVCVWERVFVCFYTNWPEIIFVWPQKFGESASLNRTWLHGMVRCSHLAYMGIIILNTLTQQKLTEYMNSEQWAHSSVWVVLKILIQFFLRSFPFCQSSIQIETTSYIFYFFFILKRWDATMLRTYSFSLYCSIV